MQMLKELEAKGVSVNSSGLNFAEEAQYIFQVYSRTRVFEGNMEYLKNNLPPDNLLDADTKKLLKTIKENPHFLADSPNHFLTKDKTRAPNLEDIQNSLMGPAAGTKESKAKIKEMNDAFAEFEDGKYINEAIKQIRDISAPENKMDPLKPSIFD
jgi:hypothetical protein